MDDGSYSVKVVVKPIDIIDQLNSAWYDFSENFEAKYADVDPDAMTDAEWEDWYVNTYDADYGQSLADLLESRDSLSGLHGGDLHPGAGPARRGRLLLSQRRRFLQSGLACGLL